MRQQQPPCPWDETCTAQAAHWENLEAIQWMRAQKPQCPWDAQCCRGFASRGNLSALLWLRQQEPPCPWDAKPSQEAALRGNLPMLKWIRSQGGPLTGELYMIAARKQYIHVVQWLHQENIPMMDLRETMRGHVCACPDVPGRHWLQLVALHARGASPSQAGFLHLPWPCPLVLPPWL